VRGTGKSCHRGSGWRTVQVSGGTWVISSRKVSTPRRHRLEKRVFLEAVCSTYTPDFTVDAAVYSHNRGHGETGRVANRE